MSGFGRLGFGSEKRRFPLTDMKLGYVVGLLGVTRALASAKGPIQDTGECI